MLGRLFLNSRTDKRRKDVRCRRTYVLNNRDSNKIISFSEHNIFTKYLSITIIYAAI